MIANCNHDSDHQYHNIVIEADRYYEHVQLQYSQLKLTNCSHINYIGIQNSNDKKDETQHCTQ